MTVRSVLIGATDGVDLTIICGDRVTHRTRQHIQRRFGPAVNFKIMFICIVGCLDRTLTIFTGTTGRVRVTVGGYENYLVS